MLCRSAIVVLGCFSLACSDVTVPLDYDDTGGTGGTGGGSIISPQRGQDLAFFETHRDLVPDDYPTDDIDSSDPSLKIVNGDPAPADEFKFIVSLRRNNRHICGGSLLDDNKSVVTAAHCVFKNDQATSASSLSVAVGIRKRSAVPNSNVIQVNQVVVHPSYNENKIENDIAVLRLSRSVTGMSSVSTVKLPPHNREPSVGTELHTAGWGYTNEGLGSQFGSETLLKTTLKVVSQQECSTALLNREIPITQICTENQNSGTCRGDSGGPLVNRRPDGDYLVGLTSYGLPGCPLRTAEAYTKVSRFVLWIQKAARGDFSGGAVVPTPSPGSGEDSGGTGNCFLIGGTIVCQGNGADASSNQIQCDMIGSTIYCRRTAYITSGIHCLQYGGRIYCIRT